MAPKKITAKVDFFFACKIPYLKIAFRIMSSGANVERGWIDALIPGDSTESMSRTSSEGRETPPGTADYRRPEKIDNDGVLVLLDGSVAAGKTALLKSMLYHSSALFGRDCHVDVFFESVNNDFLLEFLADRKAHALSFQLHMAQNRCVTLQKAHELVDRGHIVMIDRSLAGDLTFAALNHTDGFIDDTQYKLYQSVLSYAHPNFVPFELTELNNIRTKPPLGAPEEGLFSIDDVQLHTSEEKSKSKMGVHEYADPHVCNYRKNRAVSARISECRTVFVYLSVSTEIALKRLQKRGHEEEAKAYSQEFLEKLDAQYCAVLGAFHRNGASVTHIDNNAEAAMDSTTGVFPLEHVQALWRKIELAIE